jgi:hypothetical protein
MAVADGHGSAKCFRSEVGARLAVKAAATLLPRFVEANRDAAASTVKALAERQLPIGLVQEWQQEVDKALRDTPFTEEELASLQATAGIKALASVSENKRLAFGATLLVVTITADYVLYLQLGDGDMLTVSEQGVVASPLPMDPALMANETHSLCMADAHLRFRCHVQFLQHTGPALITASTDGYSNSFASVEDFHKVGTDLLNLLKTSGANYLQDNLPNWLNESSAPPGSGDDVSLGVLYRRNLLPLDAGGTDSAPASSASPEANINADAEKSSTATDLSNPT